MAAPGHDLERIPYQQELRLLGAFLDRQRPTRFTVIERIGGFEVLMERLDPGPLREKTVFAHSTLAQQLLPVLGQRGDRVEHDWSLGFGSREDFLRALGYELEEADAYMIVLDEVDDAVIATYNSIDPTQGYSWRKRWVRLGREEIDQILKAARARRRSPIRRRIFGR